MKTIFTTGQVAKICKVAPRTVSKWFDSGRLRGYRIPGSQDRRIPREHLIRFLKEHGMPLGELEDEAMADAEGEENPVAEPEDSADAPFEETVSPEESAVLPSTSPDACSLIIMRGGISYRSYGTVVFSLYRWDNNRAWPFQ